MSINFPNSPVNNQLYTDPANNVTYIYIVDPESTEGVGKWRAAYAGDQTDIEAAIAAAIGSTVIDIESAIEDSAEALLIANEAAADAANAIAIASGIEATAESALVAATNALATATNALTVANNALAAANASVVPAGVVVWVSGLNAPTGYVVAAGQTLSRSTFSRLWSWAQASGLLSVSHAAKLKGGYSPGNGTTTFNVPDLRGEFIRGLDTGGGIDPTRAIGTLQLSQNLQHTHGISDPGHAHGINDPGHIHDVSDPGHAHVVGYPLPVFTPDTDRGVGNSSLFSIDSSTTVGTTSVGSGISIVSNGTNIGIRSVSTGITISTGGGSTEARPRNIALTPCIKV